MEKSSQSVSMNWGSLCCRWPPTDQILTEEDTKEQKTLPKNCIYLEFFLIQIKYIDCLVEFLCVSGGKYIPWKTKPIKEMYRTWICQQEIQQQHTHEKKWEWE